MRWSVGIEAEGDRVFTREEVVELADAVAASDGVASGIGTSRYGARVIVDAEHDLAGGDHGDRAAEVPRPKFFDGPEPGQPPARDDDLHDDIG